jgi:hypothetical protein
MPDIQKRVIAAYKRQAPEGFPRGYLQSQGNVRWDAADNISGEGTIFCRWQNRREIPLIPVAFWTATTHRTKFTFEPLKHIEARIAEQKATRLYAFSDLCGGMALNN